MAEFARVQVELARDTGLPKDSIVNVYHFEADDDLAGFDINAPGLISRVQTFYGAIDQYLSSTLTGQGTITVYDMKDDRPRTPHTIHPFTFTPGTTTMPTEVALCMSMQAANGSGLAIGRRRGRVFLGPFSDSVFSFGENQGDNRPNAALRETILAAADTMATGGTGTFRLAVYSPTTVGPSPHGTTADETIDAAWNDVVLLYIDDAWDTMRSRGASPTSRVSVVVS